MSHVGFKSHHCPSLHEAISRTLRKREEGRGDSCHPSHLLTPFHLYSSVRDTSPGVTVTVRGGWASAPRRRRNSDNPHLLKWEPFTLRRDPTPLARYGALHTQRVEYGREGDRIVMWLTPQCHFRSRPFPLLTPSPSPTSHYVIQPTRDAVIFLYPTKMLLSGVVSYGRSNSHKGESTRELRCRFSRGIVESPFLKEGGR